MIQHIYEHISFLFQLESAADGDEHTAGRAGVRNVRV